MCVESTGFNNEQAARIQEVASFGSVFRLRNGSRTVEALFLSLILCNFLAALYGIVAILTGLVPKILHLAMNFAKEVLVGLVFHTSSLLLASP
jgi:hypothetical protein